MHIQGHLHRAVLTTALALLAAIAPTPKAQAAAPAPDLNPYVQAPPGRGTDAVQSDS